MLARAHHYHADYMQDAVAGSQATDSPADLSPELTVSTYRWVPERGNPDEFNEALVQAIHGDGLVFVSSTRITDATSCVWPY